MRNYLNSRFNFLVWPTLFFIVLDLSCRQKPPQESEANVPEPGPAKIEARQEVNTVEVKPTPEPNKTEVAVTVNGVDITEGDIEAQFKPLLDRITSTRQQSPALIEQYKKMLRQQTLDRMVADRLLDTEIKQANITVTEQEVTGQLEEIASAQKITLEEFKKRMESFGQNFDEIKQQLQRQLAVQKLLDAKFGDQVKVTEADAQTYYDENPDRFKTPEQVRASHILIQPDPNMDPNQAKVKARAEAQDLLKQIKEGADFAELAKAHSDCPSRERGGDLNFFGRGQMVPPFEEAAFKLKPGQVSDIVETKFGYHIIKVTDHREADVIAYEQAKENILKMLKQRKQSELFKEYIESLKAKANIVYPPGKEPRAVRPSVPGVPQS